MHALEALNPIDGSVAELRGHLFEIDLVGLPRGLFWSFHIQCKPVRYFDDVWEPSILLDWLRTPPLQPMTLCKELEPDAECSLYIYGHDIAHQWQFCLESASTSASSLIVKYELEVDYLGWDDDADARLKIVGSAPLRVGPIIVRAENFSPRPRSSDEAKAMILPFFPEVTTWSELNHDASEGGVFTDENTYLFSR